MAIATTHSEGPVQRLTGRISEIDRMGFLDASILGETVHPKNFNTLRRISEEDNTVIPEEEQFGELASNEFLLRQLLDLLRAGGKEMLESLPYGIHSGLIKPDAKDVFFYFDAPRPNGQGRFPFWRYYDIASGFITDNRFLITSLIACSSDTPRVVADVPVFDIQEKVIADILQGFESQQSLERVPRAIDPFQQTVATTLQEFIAHPDVDRKQLMDALRYLTTPLTGAQIKDLRKAYQEFSTSQNPVVLLKAVLNLMEEYGAQEQTAPGQLSRDDLRLVCFDVLSS